MKIVKNQSGSDVQIAVEGRLDTVTAPELEKALKESMPDATSLTLDFTDLEYISSAGLRVLLMAHKEMAKRGPMKVVHASPLVLEVFDVTGFSDILTIE